MVIKYNDVELPSKKLSDKEFKQLFCFFYSCDTLTEDIIEYCKTKFKKPLDALDVMNVAIFTLHGIVKSETDSDKKAVVNMISDMVNDKYVLNEWIYTMSSMIKAHDKTFGECIFNGDIDDIDEKIEKAVKEAEYEAWNTELSVIKRKTSAKDRITERIKGA